MSEVIKINDIEYIRKDSLAQVAPDLDGMKAVRESNNNGGDK